MSIVLDKTPFLDNAISVSEVNATIKACMDAPIFKGLSVFGEISGFKLSGVHAYFTLKDKQSQLSCVCFYCARTYMPKDGESVVVKGSLDYYVKGGRLSLQVSEIKPVGQGLLFLEFERLKEQLKKEGLFDEAHKKPIPKFCKRVLVLTSKTGAVIRDIVTTVRRKNPIIDIVVRDVRVQGEGVGKDIAGVLAKVDTLGYDVIIIARGGGSLEDLAPFYDETLARAVYAANTPIISAVGHETDFSLCDFVADMRAPTPTAAGELVAYDYYAMVATLEQAMNRMVRQSKRCFANAQTKLQHANTSLQYLAKGFWDRRRHMVLSNIDRMKNSVVRHFDTASARAQRAVVALDNLGPLKTLARGYFRLQVGEHTVSSVEGIAVGQQIKAVGADGVVSATVDKVETFEKR